MRRRPERRPTLWQRLRRLLGLGSGPEDPPPPDDEPALVPVGPPRRPRPSRAAALDLPDEPTDVDARGDVAR
jgi:hypothetical protein